MTNRLKKDSSSLHHLQKLLLTASSSKGQYSNYFEHCKQQNVTRFPNPSTLYDFQPFVKERCQVGKLIKKTQNKQNMSLSKNEKISQPIIQSRERFASEQLQTQLLPQLSCDITDLEPTLFTSLKMQRLQLVQPCSHEQNRPDKLYSKGRRQSQKSLISKFEECVPSVGHYNISDEGQSVLKPKKSLKFSQTLRFPKSKGGSESQIIPFASQTQQQLEVKAYDEHMILNQKPSSWRVKNIIKQEQEIWKKKTLFQLSPINVDINQIRKMVDEIGHLKKYSKKLKQDMTTWIDKQAEVFNRKV